MVNKYTSITSIVLAVLFLCSALMALQTGKTAPNFNLKDQFGKSWDLPSLKNKVVVVVAANKDSGKSMGPWVDKLKTKYGSKIQVLGLLDLHGIPGIGRAIAKSRIKKETKDPMMLDFKGETGRAYEVSDKYPVVVCIDKNSQVRSAQKTLWNQNAWNAMTGSIDAALK